MNYGMKIPSHIDIFKNIKYEKHSDEFCVYLYKNRLINKINFDSPYLFHCLCDDKLINFINLIKNEINIEILLLNQNDLEDIFLFNELETMIKIIKEYYTGLYDKHGSFSLLHGICLK